MFNRKYIFKWWFSIVVSVFGGYMFNCRPSICWYLCCQYFHGHHWVMKRFAGPISSRSQQGVGDVTWQGALILSVNWKISPTYPWKIPKKDPWVISFELWVFGEVWGTGPQFTWAKSWMNVHCIFLGEPRPRALRNAGLGITAMRTVVFLCVKDKGKKTTWRLILYFLFGWLELVDGRNSLG